MIDVSLPVQTLEYQAVDDSSWQPVVRTVALLFAANATLTLVNVAEFVLRYTQSSAIARNLPDLIAAGIQMCRGAVAIIAVIVCIGMFQLRRRTAWKITYIAAILIVLNCAGGLAQSYSFHLVMIRVSNAELASVYIGIVSSVIGISLVPLFAIWLVRRDEVRRMLG